MANFNNHLFVICVIILSVIIMTTEEKLQILADSAKYDASCSSSGSTRSNKNGLGNAAVNGICHSFSADGRCISLLKILLTNCCIFDCKYCLNRRSNNIKRAIFTPEEVCEITINFYKRNYIEGLFLSSGIIKSPDYTMELLIKTISLLRYKYNFHGYIHAKAIPGSNEMLVKKLGKLVDRLSTNIELPSKSSLKLLAPNKNSDDIETIMTTIKKNTNKTFAPAGQSTQMIIGATKESDKEIMQKSSTLYQSMHLKRVFYSAYIPVNKDNYLPSITTPPLIRENRLYQTDWLLRFYHFSVSEIFDKNENLNILIDPKTNWAINHLEYFPKEINTATFNELIRIPGIGITSAKKIVSSRKYFTINFTDLKNMGISIKKAKYFITCNNKFFDNLFTINKSSILQSLIAPKKKIVQLSLFNNE